MCIFSRETVYLRLSNVILFSPRLQFLLLSISIVFEAEIKIQVTEMPTIFCGSNSLNEKFGQRGISGHLGQ